jgi:pimeloyl-ACP methyl ester carboxylesterase
MNAVEGLRRFDRPTLLLWGKQDTNFGPAIAERMANDIPGVVGVTYLEESAHMPFQEEPDRYADAVRGFLDADMATLNWKRTAFRATRSNTVTVEMRGATL